MERFLFKNGEINLSKLSSYLGYKSYNSIKKMMQNNKPKFDVLYLGAVAQINGLTIEDVETYLLEKEKNK